MPLPLSDPEAMEGIALDCVENEVAMDRLPLYTQGGYTARNCSVCWRENYCDVESVHRQREKDARYYIRSDKVTSECFLIILLRVVRMCPSFMIGCLKLCRVVTSCVKPKL